MYCVCGCVRVCVRVCALCFHTYNAIIYRYTLLYYIAMYIYRTITIRTQSIINLCCTAISEITSSIGVQLKYLRGLPSGTARVEVTGYQRNGQVHMYIYNLMKAHEYSYMRIMFAQIFSYLIT